MDKEAHTAKPCTNASTAEQSAATATTAPTATSGAASASSAARAQAKGGRRSRAKPRLGAEPPARLRELRGGKSGLASCRPLPPLRPRHGCVCVAQEGIPAEWRRLTFNADFTWGSGVHAAFELLACASNKRQKPASGFPVLGASSIFWRGSTLAAQTRQRLCRCTARM